MPELMSLYNNLKSPIESEESIKKITSAWISAEDQNQFYSNLMKLGGRNDTSQVNISDREEFFINAYNDYLSTILSVPDEVSKKYPNIDAMKRNLASIGKFKSVDEIQQLIDNKHMLRLEILEGGWEHIKSAGTILNTESEMDVKHRLYLSCQNKDMYKLMNLFRNKCKESGIPYYFKATPTEHRDDEIVIYSDTQHLEDYLSILEEIERENPEIINRCGQPPLLTGKVNDWIGIGDEPPKNSKERQSFNELNSDLFDLAIKSGIISSIEEHKGKKVMYNGKETTFNTILLEECLQYMTHHLNALPSHWMNTLGITTNEIGSDNLNTIITNGFKKNLSKGLHSLINGSQEHIAFSIPTRNGKSIDVSKLDMAVIIKKIAPVMLQIDADLPKKIQSEVKNICQKRDRDIDKFCFHQGTKKAFEERDKSQSSTDKKTKIQYEQEQGTKIPSEPEMVTLPSGVQIPRKQYEEEQGTKIPSEPEMVTLPNGVQIPRKQYEEEQGTKIPSEPEMVTLPNGIQIPKTQYEQEYGTGKSDKPEMVTLPNGVQIPKTQYEQEYGTGKSDKPEMVTLSNGVQIPKTQYEQEHGTKKNISLTGLKSDLSKGKVAEREHAKYTNTLVSSRDIKKLKVKQQMGDTLSKEEELLAAHLRQHEQNTITFQQNQQNKKKQNHGLEM